jgi:hypothetical protein
MIDTPDLIFLLACAFVLASMGGAVWLLYKNEPAKLMKSWKTTLTGILAIAAAAVGYFKPEWSAALNSLAAILGGLGLTAARDNGVTSEQAGAK